MPDHFDILAKNILVSMELHYRAIGLGAEISTRSSVLEFTPILTEHSLLLEIQELYALLVKHVVV